MKKSFAVIVLVVFSVFVLAGCKNSDPKPVCGTAFGNTEDLEAGNWTAGHIIGSKFTMDGNTNVNELYLRLTQPGKFCAAIYRDTANEPGTKIIQSSINTGIAGLNSVTITATVLTGGISYWLVFISDTVGAACCDGCTGEYGAISYGYSNVESSGFPATLSSSWNIYSGKAKIYAAGCN